MFFLAIGSVYRQKGDFNRANDYFERSLAYFEEIGNNQLISEGILELLITAINNSSFSQAKNYLERLQQINDLEDGLTINQNYRFAHALLLKNSTRMSEKVKAHEIFQELVNEKVISYQLTFHAMLNLCKLLLDELKAYGEDSVLQEVKTLVHKLYASAQKKYSFPSAINALILKAKLAMIEGNLTPAVQFLNQALLTAEENNLGLLAKKASMEKKQLEVQFDKWRKYIQDNISFEERLEHARVTEYLKEAKKMISIQNLEPLP